MNVHPRDMWEPMWACLDVQEPPSATGLARDAEIAAFERKRGTPLPESYKAFVRRLGAGTLGGLVILEMPDRSSGRTGSLLPPLFNAVSLCREDGEEVTDDLLFFARTIGGDGFAFDTSRVSSEEPLEYAVVAVERMAEVVEYVGESFPAWIEFLSRICHSSEPGELPFNPARS